MGVEVRRVPFDWQHPRDAAGRYRPLLRADFAAAAAAWDAGCKKWDRGLVASHCSLPGVPAWRPRDQFTRARDYEEHAGPRPLADAYMPAWPAQERAGWMMYETISAGTPISPPCHSPRELATWLANNDAIIGPDIKATAEEWLAMIDGAGRAPMFLIERGLPVSPLTIPRIPGYVRLLRWLRRTPAYD